MASSSSSTSKAWKYDVFVSFRGEDIRKTFVDHLYAALQRHHILTYQDDVTLYRDDSLFSSLMEAIESSHILVIVFSENYADSSWCLDELSHIMKCRNRDRGQIVIPIFYDVRPYDVRRLEGTFGRAFAKHELSENNKNRVQSWKEALCVAGSLSGFVPRDFANGHEAKCIQEIVRYIFDRLSWDLPDEDENLVGMRTRLEQLRSHLRIGSGGVRMVGIWGVGGGGKTSLAMSFYKEISRNSFGCCFLENISEETKIHGLKSLQEKILSTVFDFQMEVESVDIGKHKIKHMLCRQNVLIVLDDVDHLEQLEALAGYHNWFGDGSRIIITTRDEQVLKSHRVDEVCPVSLLSHDEAICLFRRHAYNEHNPVQDYEKLLQEIVYYAAGHPLTLIVLGSFLYDKDKDEWLSTLDRLKSIPEMDIVEKLKISYDGLKPVEKKLFLDIACFFRRKRKDEAKEILDACGVSPSIGVVEVLKRKALITVSSGGMLDMHNLVHEMAHYILRQDPSILDKLQSLVSAAENEKLVGMGTRLQQLRSHLGIGSGGVRMVGIWGVGGGGKTTLATSLYMKFSADFDGCCFVENIREESKQQYGLESLQEKILSTVFDKQIQVESVDIGKSKIKRMLCRSKVLIVLDDVDHLEQLEALAGYHNWFGDGSRIIITTRDEQVLKSHKVDEVCPVSLLSNEEATQLFQRYAFPKNKPLKDYEQFSHHILSYAAGLPLVLVVLGSFLYDKDKFEWPMALDRLNYTPKMGIVEKLKISYDGLKLVEKELFLDIACFFRRWNKDEAMEILDACGFDPATGVKVLIQKALITVSDEGKFDMHDLVVEMAHYIVRGEHPNNPETYSRVWRKEDIEDICSKDSTMINDMIDAIQCYADGCSFKFIRLVSNMKNLRFLNVSTTSFDDGPNFLSNELRYIDWEGYPASLFPESFQPRKLVVLKLGSSRQKELWMGYKYLPCLKELELSYMKALVRTPDFDGLQCLQKLILKGCQSLEEIHQSLGNHSSLVHVSVSICEKLTRFPAIVKMDKLKILRISECKALMEFPEIEAKMDNLVELYLYEVGIQVLPPSVGKYCANLISLKLEWCSKLKSIQGNFQALNCLQNFHVNSYNLGSIEGSLPHSCLTTLDLSMCKLKDGEIPSEIGELFNLRELHLKCNSFARLDFSLSRLTHLKLLDLRRCKNLVELPELPSSLAILNADGCESLEVIRRDAHRRCKCLCDVSIRGDRKNINGGERLLESMLQGNAVLSGCMILQLKGLEVPRRFEPRVVRGRTCRMQIPENGYNHFSGFLFCVVLDNYGDYFDLPKITTRMKHRKITVDYSDLPKITTRMKHEKLTNDSMRMQDTQDDVYWEETDKNTCMIYVSFGLLKKTSWWDQTYNAIQLEIDSLDDGYRVIGCGSKLIPKTSETTITDSSFDKISDDYTCRLKIRRDIFHVSKSAFKFSIDCSLPPNLNVYLTKIQI